MELLAEPFEPTRFVNFEGWIDYEMLVADPPDIVLSLIVEVRLLATPVADGSLGQIASVAR